MRVPVSKMGENSQGSGRRAVPVYPSGKSWDEVPGKMRSGKKFFHNAMSGADFTAQPYYVAMVVGWTTPSRLQ